MRGILSLSRLISCSCSQVPVCMYMYVCIVFNICRDVGRWVIISVKLMAMILLFDIIEHDKRRSGTPNTPLDMEHNNNRTEKSTTKALAIDTTPT